jgi:hypothetical protein
VKSSAAAALVAMILAGCLGADSNGTPSGAAGGPAAEFSDETAALEGSVVDETLFPLQGALITMPSLGLSATTDESGAFAFSFLPPGTLVVNAELDGFESAAVEVELVAGEAAQARFILVALVGDRPYTTLSIHDGMVSCGLAFVLTSMDCASGITTGLPKPPITDVQKAHQAVVSEVTWKAPNEFMFLGYVTVPEGGKPYIMANPIERPPSHDVFISGAVNFGAPVPAPETVWKMTLSVYYAGREQPTFNNTLGPACWQAFKTVSGVPRPCSGVGFVQELRFTQYATTFYHALPGDFQAYTALPDS